MDVATADAAVALLGTDVSVRISAQQVAVTRERYGSIPHTYVVCSSVTSSIRSNLPSCAKVPNT